MKKNKEASEVREKFRYRFLDITSTAVSEEQVCSEFNFNIVVTYCSSFAEELPTKKEVEDWAVEEAGVLRSFASWACARTRRNKDTRPP
ncbi:unnamed protein product [Symbiodinium sp. CCMP2592]|nr:unnamed protein product [Symbiodinium sp. CCMP2592]CAE7483102.1 unnamed protein product [Symbiodinium sp. CCMP2592]CAE7768800.1 unnamed protein product [Symbiodinium sp. CCMP2592]